MNTINGRFNRTIKWEDSERESITHMLGHRIPWLALGLAAGIVTSLVISRFEQILSADIRLVFFIPIIVYLSDAIGTQTETIYIRNLAFGRIHFLKYLFKETLFGLNLGILFGALLGLFAYYWLEAPLIGLAVGLSTLINLVVAPVLALTIPTILYRERTDPALGAGPLATIIQDLISLLIYFSIATMLLF